jgi:hypothetical protein
MGGAFAYTYLYALCCAGIGVLFLMGWGLVSWGRREERKKRELRATKKPD